MTRWRRPLSRLGQYALVLWAAATLNFALPHLAPGDPVHYLYGGDALGLTPEQLAELRTGYGLDRPITEQYAAFWAGLVRGDLGRSVEFNRPVTGVLLDHLPWTLLLVGTATLLSAALGILWGAWAAWRRDRRGDRASVLTVLGLESMPAFWIGMVLVAVFAVQLGWFPSYGATTIDATGVAWSGEVASRLVLPLVTTTLTMTGTFFLMARASMLAVLDEPHIRLARATGISELRVMLGHGLRTALLPAYTRLTLEVGAILSGLVVVETVFAYPGLGQLIYQAVVVRDYPLLRGAFLLVTLGVVAANLLADLTYPLLDPRVRRATQAPPRPAGAEAGP